MTRARFRPAATARACVFDILALDGRDLRHLPLLARKQVLRDVLADQTDIVFVDHVAERGEELLAGARKLGIEGVVAKRAASPYAAGRTNAWLKFKAEHTADFVVIGVTEPSEGTFWRPGLVLAAVEHGALLRYAGRVAAGRDELAALEPVLPALNRKSAPCAGAGRAAVWLEPAVVCEVRFLASSTGRGLRHPVFVRFRTDKPWRDCEARS